MIDDDLTTWAAADAAALALLDFSASSRPELAEVAVEMGLEHNCSPSVAKIRAKAYREGEDAMLEYLQMRIDGDGLQEWDEDPEDPSVDAEQVIYAHWEDHPDFYGFVRCSGCKDARTAHTPMLDEWPRCPVCGAKMDAEEN